MSYTLRQVQPLLTKPELELFQASRAAAVKDIAPHRLTGKIQRARALRDKYRDVYRRQTVQTRASDPKARKALGGENTRTQTKSDIMDEVLKRFEAQHEKLKTSETAAQTRPTRAKGAPRAPVAQAPAKKKTAIGKTAAKKATAKKPGVSVSALASGVKRLQNIVKAVRKAVNAEEKTSSKKPVEKVKAGNTASGAALSSAPTDITPKAKRVNTLKAEPVQKKIHASARSRTRAAQAKRDAR